jgi:capsid protein
MIDRMVNNLMGANGFGLQARTTSKSLNDKIEKEIWKAFTSKPEYRDLYPWKKLQDGTCRDLLIAGDIGFSKLNNGQLQVIESEWINTATNDQIVLEEGHKIEQGIYMTRGGKFKGFIYNPPTPDGFGQSSVAKLIPRKNAIYLSALQQRFSRTRPIPPLIQAFSSIWRFDDILNSEAVAWQLLAKHAIIINKEAVEEEAYDLSSDDERDYQNDSSITDRVTEHDTGTIFWGDTGEKVSSVDRNLPGKDFPMSVRTFMQLFSMRIGLPLEILMLDWSKTNFSSGRAALSQATVMLESWQTLMVESFYKEVYHWVIERAIKAGDLPSVEEEPTIFDHEWFPPALPWIDPKSEAEGWGIRVDRGLVTYNDALKARGKDPQEENNQREQIIRDAIAKAHNIEAETGEVVDWRLFAGYEPLITPPVAEEEVVEDEVEEEEEPEPTKEEQDEMEENGMFEINGKLYLMHEDGRMENLSDN